MDINLTVEIQKINRGLDRSCKQLMKEIEDLLEIYLIQSLQIVHKRLVRKVVDLPQYYKEIDQIQNCIERFTEAREL